MTEKKKNRMAGKKGSRKKEEGRYESKDRVYEVVGRRRTVGMG